MGAYTTRVDFDRALRSAKANTKPIRTTLGDRTLEAWVLPAFEEALAAADEDRFGLLTVIGRPSLSRKRVQLVCGQDLTDAWSRFFGLAPMATSSPASPPARPKRQVRRRVIPKRPPARTRSGSVVVRKPTSQAVPLRDAAPLIADELARKAAREATAKAKADKNVKGERTADSYLDGVVACRECLRSYKRRQLPNPRSRVCEDCGGQPPARSVRTVSGGSPGLGRRR